MVGEQPVPLAVEVHWHPGEATFVIQGELDGPAAVDLTERLTEVARVIRVLNGEPGRLVVDMAGVTDADGAAARALAEARQQLSPDCSLVIESPSPAAIKHLGPAGLLERGSGSPAKPEQPARESGRPVPGSRAPAALDSGRAPRAAKPRPAKAKGRRTA
jgi:anti-anti-sigma regulatory factor